MLAITPLLDKENNTPLYMQLYKYIREQIEGGMLLQGSCLPSIRQLASHLNISKNTIEAAYQQLLAEGYVESKARNGFIVQQLEELPRPALLRTKPEASSSSNISDKNDVPEIRFDFRYGDMDLSRFPHDVWKACLIDALSERTNEVLGYGDRQGNPHLRAEIASYIFESRGVNCHADQIILCAGTQQAISMLCQLLALNNVPIGMEDPGYDGVKTIFHHHNCKLIPIPLQQDGLHVELLQGSAAKAVYVTPSHQFPMGMVLPIQKRMKLLQWAKERKALIIEDDYDSEFRYSGQPIPSLKALDSSDQVIYMGTLSKSFLPAARLSYIVLPQAVLGSIRSKLMSYSQPVSPIIQQAVLLFMRRGHFARHVRRMRRLYQSKHKKLLNAISYWMGDRVEVIGDRSGLHILLDVKGRNSSELIQLAEQGNCRVYTSQAHWNDPLQCPASFVMLGFGGIEESELETGIRLLSLAWFGAESGNISQAKNIVQ
ncbi:GntR family transcriptional regulator/MocR family aminotransferase [Paenibacillus castaneae]|uniref:MocR-like pyridoxine biosynthesis transcription factor PdxR n=1 Tax=Paenibacillus castaneae TaxID=474957 RepID=UPI000C9CE404|nr:PLP-dependent aminotransferase family protein [Paenibacillus castaneae]NIK75922.1 GntR family transcriptional regulator/MocR family aminotransferase [Paenibacillus castaneae]